MKILYAANDNLESCLQLNRFLINFPWDQHTLKVAGYSGYDYLIDIDFNLNFVKSFYSKVSVTLNTDNYNIFCSQLDRFEPDLIISDLDKFSSNYAILNNVKLWQYSSNLLQYCLPHYWHLKLRIANRYNYEQMYSYIINNSDKILLPTLYDQFGLTLDNKVTLVNPLSFKGSEDKEIYNNCISLLENKRKYLKLADSKSVVFTTNTFEFFNNFKLKHLYSDINYYNNIHNSKAYVCDLYDDLIFDGLLNNKTINTFMNSYDHNCHIHYQILKKMGLVNLLDNHPIENRNYISVIDDRKTIMDLL